MSDEINYVLPLEKALLLASELKQEELMASYFLQHHVENLKDKSWDDTPLPLLCEYYTATRSVRSLLMDMIVSPPPEASSDRAQTEGGFPMTSAEYTVLETLLTSLSVLRKTLKLTHNISFEIH